MPGEEDAEDIGSSPRARGTPIARALLLERFRFIPAGAGNTWLDGFRSTAYTVHPRGRGEHRRLGHQEPAIAGSSPRARGTPYTYQPATLADRFIPAGAGNTSRSNPAATARAVHPRGHGEHSCVTYIVILKIGSSPRARGTLMCHLYRDPEDRFIPAGAGNTECGVAVIEYGSVHPRGRGEHERSLTDALMRGGSSPRARGTLSRGAFLCPPRRFIPAGAGNTAMSSRSIPASTVHPRGRGEHAAICVAKGLRPGSSPRARGTRAPAASRADRERFIPAGAGNTPAGTVGPGAGAVHPRGRGEHCLYGLARFREIGSSPRARGTQGHRGAELRPGRFIPAGAGNTSTIGKSEATRAVHPRGRGEHPTPGGACSAFSGSSPRARGTLLLGGSGQHPGRFIPAGAGNTQPGTSSS